MKLDITLRCLSAGQAKALIRLVSGQMLARALPTEHPETKDQRVDTLCLLEDGSVLHIEWQACYDDEMPWRMLRYWVVIAGAHRGRHVRQVVIQVGGKTLVGDRLERPGLSYRYLVIDSRTIDRGPLLESAEIEDNILAILFGADDLRPTIRVILSRIARLDEQPRRDALTQLTILAAFRQVAHLIEEEMTAMPLVVDFAQDPYFARLFRKMTDEARDEGREKGESLMLVRLLERRFGALPADLRSRILAFDSDTAEACADRMFDAPTLAAVLGDPTLH